jgi:hypothetical protein
MGLLVDLFVIWDRRMVDILEYVKGQYTLSCKFQNVENQFVWAFSTVYGPNADGKRYKFWEELARVYS